MRADVGPDRFVVPGSYGLVLPVAPGAGSLSLSSLDCRWPAPFLVRGLFVQIRPHAVLTADQARARVSLAIVDEHNDPIVSDSRGTLTGTTFAPAAMTIGAMLGPRVRPFPLVRRVAAHELWQLTFENDDVANAITLSGVILDVRRV